jgi:hypothetical protein
MQKGKKRIVLFVYDNKYYYVMYATFSSDCKWNKHVDTLIEKTSKQKLKLKLKENILTHVTDKNISVPFNLRHRQHISVLTNTSTKL